MTFEESAKRLEEIVKKLESGKVTLDEGAKLFEEGAELVKSCYQDLDKTKGKITTIKNELDKLINDTMED